MSRNPDGPDQIRPYFARLDALRGLGALAVAGFHFSGCVLHGITLLPQAPWPDADPIQYGIGRFGMCLVPGHLAVICFFAISGFVLRLSLGHGPQTVPAASAKFVLARMFRFYPIVTAGVLAAVLSAAETQPANRVWSNLLLLDVSLNPHLWSLQVELLVIPVILALYFAERRCGTFVVPAVAAGTTALAFVPHWAIWPALSTTLFAFVIGMLIPTLGRAFAMSLSRRSAICWAVGAAAVVFAASPCFGAYSRFTEIIGGYAAAIVLSIVAYRADLPILRMLDCHWLRRIGAASGSYYVLHMAAAPWLLTLTSRVVPIDWSVRAPGFIGLALIAVWLAVITPGMIAISQLIEIPGMAVGRAIIRRLRLSPSSLRPTVARMPIPLRAAA